MEQTTKRAAIYARTAIIQERGDNFAMSEQVRQCKEHAENQGYHVVDAYQEVGSGHSTTRAGLKAVVQAVQERKFDVLIVLDFDRLARKRSLVTELLTELETYGVRVESVREPFAGDTDQSMFMQEIHTFVADIERKRIAERAQYGRVKKEH